VEARWWERRLGLERESMVGRSVLENQGRAQKTQDPSSDNEPGAPGVFSKQDGSGRVRRQDAKIEEGSFAAVRMTSRF
jgi:hypothetical protein